MLAHRLPGAGQHAEPAPQEQAAGKTVACTRTEGLSRSGTTWHRAIWNSFHYGLSRAERNAFQNQGSTVLELGADQGPQVRGGSLQRQGERSQSRTQTEHRILSLSTHRFAAARIDTAGGSWTALAAGQRATASGMREIPATVSYVRSIPSVSGKEPFVQIEKNFTSSVL